MSATVRDVMTTSVVAVKRNADFKQIVSVLRRFRVSACPVINDAGHVVGVVSEADLLYKEARGKMPAGLIRLRWKLGEESKVNAVTAGRLMTSPAITIHPDVSVAAAARMMHDRWVKRLPVVSDDGLLIGIVTRSDVLSVYERPDDAILAEIQTDVLAAEFGPAASSFDVVVTSGIVTISGRVAEPDTALSLVTKLRQIEGVVAVRDWLSPRQPERSPEHQPGLANPGLANPDLANPDLANTVPRPTAVPLVSAVPRVSALPRASGRLREPVQDGEVAHDGGPGLPAAAAGSAR
jgi:CBS domain-containing protein